MTAKPKYYFNLDGNITDGEKEYSLYNIEDVVGGLSISSDLKERYVLYGRNSLLDLLNEQHEQIHFLNMKYAERTSIIGEQSLKIENLEKENEQLKTTIQQLTNDNTKQKKLLNTTMKENEHIKQTINDMINTERTELGKMTLRHLWRQIQ